MTASEIALDWDKMDGLLETLFDACLIFDAQRIRELLVQAPLGYQPQSEPVDLVWEQQAHQARQHSPGTPKDENVIALHARPTFTAS